MLQQWAVTRDATAVTRDATAVTRDATAVSSDLRCYSSDLRCCSSDSRGYRRAFSRGYSSDSRCYSSAWKLHQCCRLERLQQCLLGLQRPEAPHPHPTRWGAMSALYALAPSPPFLLLSLPLLVSSSAGPLERRPFARRTRTCTSNTHKRTPARPSHHSVVHSSLLHPWCLPDHPQTSSQGLRSEAGWAWSPLVRRLFSDTQPPSNCSLYGRRRAGPAGDSAAAAER